MERTKIKFRNGYGGFSFAWAIITDSDYIWCFDEKTDNYGYTICKSDIVKVYKTKM